MGPQQLLAACCSITTSGRTGLCGGRCACHREPLESPDNEYANLYARFEELVRTRAIDVDVTPLRLVADAFMCGRRTVAEPFVE